MAKPSNVERKAARVAARTPPPGWQDPLAQQQPLISGRWLVRAVLMVILFAAISSYLTLCLLFYQGQWQVVFQPSRSITVTPSSVGLRYDEVHFDYTGSGTPLLAGWWIPAETDSRSSRPTMLFFHDGRGSLSDTVDQLKELHALNINIFALDYRGFGNSANMHPSEQRVYQDADAAWTYLTDIRHLSPRSIVLYGTGLGAVIAAETARRSQTAAALVLENPSPPALTLIAADARTSLLPVRWLFRDRFELKPILSTLQLPTLVLLSSQENTELGSLGPGAKAIIYLSKIPREDPKYLPTIQTFINATPAENHEGQPGST